MNVSEAGKMAGDSVDLASTIYNIFSGKGDFSPSLTNYVHSTSVTSRSYIEEGLIDEDVMVSLCGFTNQMYIGYVIAALQLSNNLSQYRTIRTGLTAIANEGFDMEAEVLKEFCAAEGIDMEASVVELEKKTGHLFAARLIEFDFIVGREQSAGRSSSTGSNKSGTDDIDNYDEDGSVTGSSRKTGISPGSSSSKGKDHKSSNKAVTVTVPIHVSMIPAAITPEVADAFLSLNFKPSFGQRYMQWRAGEIKLIKDLILSRDLVAKYAKAVHKDKTGALGGMLKRNSKNKLAHFWGMAQRKYKNNTASSILIFDKRTLDQSSHEARINMAKFGDRQRFFKASMAMMVISVDTTYERVQVWLNGVDGVMDLPYTFLKKSGGDNNSMDLKMVMEMLNQGKSPKF